jgi:hypothetical protein
MLNMSQMGHNVQLSNKSTGRPKMQCPHLKFDQRKKICMRMLEEGLIEEVTEFDLKHYCRGDPTCCYYFRTSPQGRMTNRKDAAKNKTRNLVTAT